MKSNEVAGRREGKSIYILAQFISKVREGSCVILHGPGYVVMTDEHYNKLLSAANSIKEVSWDEG